MSAEYIIPAIFLAWFTAVVMASATVLWFGVGRLMRRLAIGVQIGDHWWMAVLGPLAFFPIIILAWFRIAVETVVWACTE